MDLNCDLHLHSPFARGVSRRMTPEVLLAASAQKGIGAIGTGDALQPEWRKAWRPHLENDFGIVVLPTVEVQAERRVHHLAFFPDFDAVEAFGDLLAPHGSSLGSEGRPHVHLTGGEIVRAAHDAGGLAGPSHAFTPWTGIYAAFDSIAACYGGEPIDFLELGLSADSSYGAGITELYGVPFISASDAHSPELHRLGREFTRLNVDRPDAGGRARGAEARRRRAERRSLSRGGEVQRDGLHALPPSLFSRRGRGARVALPRGSDAAEEGRPRSGPRASRTANRARARRTST